jgi:hypothetical protein
MCLPCGISVSLVAAKEDAKCFFLRPLADRKESAFPRGHLLLGYSERSQLIGIVSIHSGKME